MVKIESGALILTIKRGRLIFCTSSEIYEVFRVNEITRKPKFVRIRI